MSALALALAGCGGAVALFDFVLGRSGQQLTITNNILSQMTIDANFQSNTNCTSRQTGSQSLSIEPGTDYPPAAHITEKGGPCDRCVQALASIREMRDDLEKEAVEKSGGRYQPQTASAPMLIAMTGSGVSDTNTIGACDLMCADVVIFSVLQSEVFSSETDCQVDNTVDNTLTQTLTGSINSSLTNQQDIIGLLESAFTSNQESISANLASILSQSVTTVVSQQLLNSTLAAQQFNVGIGGSSGGSGAHSCYVNTAAQTFTANSIATLSVTNSLTNSLRQTADFSISQTLLNSNDTIGDLSKDFLQIIDSMSEFLTTIVGSVLVILGAVILLAVMLISALYIVNPSFRTNFDKLLGDLPSIASQRLKKK